MKEYITQIAPYVVSLVIAAIGWLITLIRTSTSNIASRINKKNAIIDRSAITDPTGYYKASNLIGNNYKIYYQGKEISKDDLRFVRIQEESGKENVL